MAGPGNTPVRQWLPLSLIFLAVGLATAMAFPFMTLFLSTAVGATPIQMAVFLVASPLSAVLVSSRLGKLSDRRRIRRRLLITAGVAGCIAFVVTAFVRNYGVLLALTLSVTAVAGTMLPQSFAYARAVLGDSDRAALTISRLRTLFSIAWVAGPPLASVLLDVGGFRAVYGMAATMYALAGLVAWRMLDSRGDARPPAPEATTEHRPTPVKSRASLRVLWAAIVAFALLQAAGNVGVQALPLLIGHNLGGQARSAGLILGLCAALEIPLMLGLGMLSTRMPVYRLLLAGSACALAYAVLATAA
ncbi:MAG TPA: MFS transporter, partial [Micromonosporaceae bacterium]